MCDRRQHQLTHLRRCVPQGVTSATKSPTMSLSLRARNCGPSAVRSFFLFPCVVALVLLVIPGSAFLGRGTLLPTEGDIFGIYCPEFDRGTRVWHHREITREAVRRVIGKYFQEVPPATGSYDHREGMTLEESYAEYYGPDMSPKPFLHSLSYLVDAAVQADHGLLGADPRYHFGSERFSESQTLLVGRWRRIIKASQAGDYTSALYLLGLSLTAIQDFYSHTNWVELGNTEFNHDVGVNGKDFKNVASFQEGTCKDCPEAADGAGSCPNNLLQEILDSDKLTSGYTNDAFVDGNRVEKPLSVDKCSHGGPRDRSRRVGARGGINKDLPTACFSPHHHLHHQAAKQAVQVFSRLFGLHPTPALVIILDTTDSMDEELSALIHSVKRLVIQHSTVTYPPAEYILVPFNDPLYGPVTRSQRPDEIYLALTQLQAIGGGDEAELSMSALLLGLHHAPPYSHLYLFTDASIKDPELFDTVVTLALAKSVKVTPVLTMPVRFGGITGKLTLKEDVESHLNSYDNDSDSNRTANTSSLRLDKHSSSSRRPKRQLQSFGKYSELAERTGGQILETDSDKVTETSRILEEEQYPMAVLWRESYVTSLTKVRVPVDSLVRQLEVSIAGGVSTAHLISPSGTRFDLAALAGSVDHMGYTVVAFTPYLIQVRINMAQRQKDFGEWTLSFDPTDVSSAVIYAHTPMDILPAYYTPDAGSIQPSLQRVMGQPSTGQDTYLDLVITGVDTAGLRLIDSVSLRDESGTELSLDVPIKSPRRNTYLRLPTRRLPEERFTVVVTGEDGAGKRFRRESGKGWELVESTLSFPLGRDIWGPPGANLIIPVAITNSAAPNTYFITAYDALGSQVRVNQKRVQLGRNETMTLKVTMVIDPQALPHTTNSLIVTATSTHGHTALAHAHLSVTAVRLDTDPVTNNLPYFTIGDHIVEWQYKAKCCQPHLTIHVYDRASNLGVCQIDNGNVSGGDNLNTGEIAGIAVGSVLGLVVLVLLIIFIVIRLRRSKKENITLNRAASRTSAE
ncbi:von Willebrand factor A domain-containing protein 7-like 2 [Homarus americanus]|uniref:von Willebrand factor A domain-containing protein 7-like 2 n=1 Tax=Homarus americanus TaxID=6706 RepID=A0A8J5JPX4_HOMAM|nr:von Willebrand factor A domain-containing protein 7-like 2 [Homarus americanus]